LAQPALGPQNAGRVGRPVFSSRAKFKKKIIDKFFNV